VHRSEVSAPDNRNPHGPEATAGADEECRVVRFAEPLLLLCSRIVRRAPISVAGDVAGASDIVRTLPEAHFNLGVAYVVTGNRGAAEREIRILAVLAPPLAARLADFVAQPQPEGASGR